MYWLAREGDRLRRAFVQRFDPMYWTMNFPRPMMASVVTAGTDGLTIRAVFYNRDDLAGLIWESEDRLDHPLLRYETNRDYRGVTLRFRWQSSNVMPLDALWGPTLTIEGRDAAGAARSWYVRLWNYAEGSPEDAVIALDFDALNGGFLLPAEADPVYAGDVDRMFISLVPQQYDGSTQGPLAGGAVEAEVIISDMVADGATGLETGAGYVRPHGLNIANGYDDTFNQTPERLIRNFVHLGYRGRINHYVGMSHYFSLAYDSGDGRYVVDPSAPALNGAAAAWHADFLVWAQAYGFEVILSMSFELLADHIPLAWRQLAHDGSPALTGWDPPSSLVSPANAEGMDYLEGVFLAFAGLQDAAGLPVLMQLGEPWWWIDPATGVPFFYDAEATALYEAQTGKPVPPALTSVFETPDAAQQAYVDWLGGQLGVATLGLRDALKTAYPSAQATVLIYTPQILMDGAAMAATANLPAAWAAPAFDFVQLEDYDHVIAGDWARHEADLGAMAALGYGAGETEYFSGFILNAGDEDIWINIDQAVDDAAMRGFRATYVWAYSQTVRDGFTYFTLEGEDEVSGFHEVRLPAGIAYGATGGPGFSTQVVAAASGFEQRNANWQQARARYTIGTGLTSEADLHALIAFFRARLGRAHGFRFKDWSDYTSGPTGSAPSAVDQRIGTGDGTTVRFQLIKTYSSGEGGQVRPITKPVTGTVRIALDAVEQVAGWSVDITIGIVTFETPPGDGVAVQAGFEFDVPVRFDTDTLDVSLETFRAGAVPQIPLVELRQA